MDLKDILKQLGDRVLKLKDQIGTEEATKNAFVMPFIQALGYDLFNPLEVVPEYTADIGLKKGEKVDYAILKDGQPIILIECKHWQENLDVHNSQLFRYFHTTKAKFGLLTNGIQYRFYTDLIETNKMDEKPFLELDLTNIKEIAVNEVKKFHKSYFDANIIISAASELKYSSEIKAILNNELSNPSSDFVKFFTGRVYQGRATEKVLAQFTELVKTSSTQLINDIINERLQAALKKEEEKVVEEIKAKEDQKEEKILTTEEELEGYYIIKAILCKQYDSKRIFFRDFQNFFSILLDDTIRQTICRLYMNDSKKYISWFDETKKEIKTEFVKLDDIYNYSEQLILATDRLINGSTISSQETTLQ